jgi:hypothetical protein
LPDVNENGSFILMDARLGSGAGSTAAASVAQKYRKSGLFEHDLHGAVTVLFFLP